MGVNQLGSQLTVYSTESRRRIVQPVVVVDQKQVVAGIQNPAESGLPAKVPTVVVVLNVAGQRDPRAELSTHIRFKDADREAALGQFDPCPFVVQPDDQAVEGTDGQTRFEITTGTAEIVPHRYCPPRATGRWLLMFQLT